MMEDTNQGGEYTAIVNKAMEYYLAFGRSREESIETKLLNEFPKLSIGQTKEIDVLVREIRNYVEDLFMRLTTDELKQSDIDEQINQRYNYLTPANINKLKNLSRYDVLK